MLSSPKPKKKPHWTIDTMAVLERPDPEDQPKKLNPPPQRMDGSGIPQHVLDTLTKLYNIEIEPPSTGS